MRNHILPHLFTCDGCKISHFFKNFSEDGIWWENLDHENIFIDLEEFKRIVKLKVFK
jgi:hypothetical protein